MKDTFIRFWSNEICICRKLPASATLAIDYLYVNGLAISTVNRDLERRERKREEREVTGPNEHRPPSTNNNRRRGEEHKREFY